MFLRALIIGLTILWSGGLAAAQSTSVSVAGPPPACPVGSYLGSTSTIWTCTAMPAAASSVTLTSTSPCLNVTGGPAYVIAPNAGTTTITAGRAALPSDQCQTIEYNNATTPGTYTLGASGTAPYTNGWIVCFGVRAMPLTLASAGGTLYGGAVTLAKGDSECVKADDQGGWGIFAGTSRTIPNPNPFQ
jgi:hypothetical protein